MMYPFVPDNMRSPEGVQLMMSDPEIRDRLENALQQAFKVGNLYLSVCPCLSALSVCLHVCLPACLLVFLSACLSVCLLALLPLSYCHTLLHGCKSCHGP